MDRYLLISSDGHAGPPLPVFRDYLDPKHRRAYDDWMNVRVGVGANAGATKIDLVGPEKRESFAADDAVQAGGRHGAWDPGVRARELDREGVAAEVLFPDGTLDNDPPFALGLKPPRMEYPLELRQAGARAYNRWLADLCTSNPGRHAGLVLLELTDVDWAVAEIRRSRNAGLFGGVLLPALLFWTDDPEKFWHHPRYKPIWDVCEELAIPVHTHTSGPVINYGDTPGSRWIISIEAYLTAYRPFYFLLWSGVFERHPKLKFVVTESGGGNVPYMLKLFDYLAEVRNPEARREIFSLKPSEYWARQCYVGASPPSGRPEVEARHEIGVERIMWGSDYPHIEGTWPESRERLREMFGGVPESEVRLMVGENAARLYDFDRERLRAIADRIGPPASELGVTRPATG